MSLERTKLAEFTDNYILGIRDVKGKLVHETVGKFYRPKAGPIVLPTRDGEKTAEKFLLLGEMLCVTFNGGKEWFPTDRTLLSQLEPIEDGKTYMVNTRYKMEIDSI